MGGAKAPPSDVEETRLPGAKRFVRCAKSLSAAARARVPHDGIDDMLDSRRKEVLEKSRILPRELEEELDALGWTTLGGAELDAVGRLGPRWTGDA